MEDYDAGILLLMEKYHIPLILLSMGKNGSRAYTDKFRVERPAFVTEDTIETTGAGDAFAVVSCITYWNMDGVNTMKRNWRDAGVANAAASIVTTRKGRFG